MTAELPRLTIETEIRRWQEEIRRNCIDKGWRGPHGEARVTFGEAMALLHSEVSEALEAFRSWGTADHTAEKDYERGGMRPGKPEGVGSEFADILIRLLDDCDTWGIDLAAEVERKLTYNRTRTFRHGGKAL